MVSIFFNFQVFVNFDVFSNEIFEDNLFCFSDIISNYYEYSTNKEYILIRSTKLKYSSNKEYLLIGCAN